MEAGLNTAARRKFISISDRKEAIKTAVSLAQPADIVLVAGKGHEKYQEIKGVKYPFDDKAVLKEIFEYWTNRIGIESRKRLLNRRINNMLYHLFDWLKQTGVKVPGGALFQFITFRVLLAVIIVAGDHHAFRQETDQLSAETCR